MRLPQNCGQTSQRAADFSGEVGIRSAAGLLLLGALRDSVFKMQAARFRLCVDARGDSGSLHITEFKNFLSLFPNALVERQAPSGFHENRFAVVDAHGDSATAVFVVGKLYCVLHTYIVTTLDTHCKGKTHIPELSFGAV